MCRPWGSEESFDQLVCGYLAGVDCGNGNGIGKMPTHGAMPLLWPLYSNQPSLNDAAFVRRDAPAPVSIVERLRRIDEEAHQERFLNRGMV